MRVTVIPLTDFVHDDMKAHAGREIPGVDKTLADELARNGLVRIRMLPLARAPRQREFVDVGKAQAAGTEQQPSSSPAAPASQPTTARGSKHGGRFGRTNAR